jgi:hypothetical protein
MNAYLKGTRHIAVAGRVAPQYGSPDTYGWQKANDENDDTFAQTLQSASGIVELDFGASGVETDSILIRHRVSDIQWNTDRRTGTRFTALNASGKEILRYEFTAQSPNYVQFVYPKTTPKP